jgi:hypothetical protein
MSMGRDYVSELRPPAELFFTPRCYMSMENHGEMILALESSWFVQQNYMQSYQQSSGSKQEERAKEPWI